MVIHNFGALTKSMVVTGIKNPVAEQGGAKLLLKGGTYTASLPGYSSIVLEIN
jgi:hypothetical protein